jgi:UDP-N-acetyl-2-amino-2-deoxyglucuronate dehydrogenase
VGTLKFALIGCGRISKRHADLLGKGLISNAKLAAVCDSNSVLASQRAAEFQLPKFTDMHKMMEVIQPDVVVVLTESGLHATHVIELTKYQKHIVVEKPMALRLSDADRMIEGCDKAGIKLFVVKQNRFNRPIAKLRQAMEAGRFGKLVLGTVRVRWCRPQDYYDQAPWRGTWAMDGGVLSNQASHHIDMLEWMMGDVECVQAMASTRLVNIEAEDTAVVTLRFSNGALGVIEATTAARPRDMEGSISILGEKGAVEVGGFAMNEIRTWQFCDPIPEDDLVRTEYSVNPPNVYGFGHQAYYEHVVKSILENGPNLIDGLAGRKSLELINAIYESIETGKRIHLRFNPEKSRLGSQHE